MKTRTFAALSNRGMGRALRHKQFRYYVLFGFASTLGLWIHRIAMQWLVWELTGSFAMLGAIATTEALAVTAVMPLGGVWADRYDRLRLGRFAKGAGMAVALAIALLVYGDLMTLPLLFAMAVATGIADGFWSPVRMTIVPRIVPPQDLSPALGVTASYFHASQFIGPALGGLIIAGSGPAGAFLVNAISSLGIFAFLFFVTLSGAPETTSETTEMGTTDKDPARATLWAVVRNLRQAPILLFALLTGAATGALLRPFRELLAGYADGVFDAGSSGFALLASASGGGAVLASLIVANLATAPSSRSIMVSYFLASLGMIGFGLASNMTVAAGAAAWLSFWLTYLGINAQIAMQKTVADRARGRVMSLWAMQLRGLPALGAFIIGLIGDSWPLQSVLLAAAALSLISGAILLVRRPLNF